MRKLQKVRNLLRAGRSKSFIAKSLSLTKYRVDKLVGQLIETNMKRTKKPSKLTVHEKLIQANIQKGSDVKGIYNSLLALNQQVHYSTVARYVRELKESALNNVLPHAPGETTYLFLIRISGRKKEKKKEVYLFCMMLGYSLYSFFAPIKGLCIWSFLRIHAAAFRFFGGSTKTVKFCEVSSLCLTESELKIYQLFLTHYGSQLHDIDTVKENVCREHTYKIKKDILSELFQQDFKRFARTLKQKYARPFNLRLHPVTKKSIRKEFKLTEQPKLLPLPEYNFPLPTVAYRKASKRGLVCYRYKQYKLPIQYKGQMVKVVEEERQIRFILKGETIASYRFLKSGKKGYVISKQSKFTSNDNQTAKTKN